MSSRSESLDPMKTVQFSPCADDLCVLIGVQVWWKAEDVSVSKPLRDVNHACGCHQGAARGGSHCVEPGPSFMC